MTSEFSQPSGTTSAPSDEAPEIKGSQLDDLKKSVTEDVTAAKKAIAEGGATATEKIKEAVSEQTGFAARQVGGVADALQKVGAELEHGDQPHVGRYTRQIGVAVKEFATKMEGKDAGELARLAEDLGRRQPLAFLGFAAVAGLMASRFLTASAHRERRGGGVDRTSVNQAGSPANRGGSSNG